MTRNVKVRRPPAKHVETSRTRTRVERKGQYDDDYQTVKDTESGERVVVAGEPARVRMSAGVTKNMGNYESLRVDVSIEMPCDPKAVDKVAEDTAEKVSQLLDDEVQNYMG